MECEERIDLDALRTRDPILFYDEVYMHTLVSNLLLKLGTKSSYLVHPTIHLYKFGLSIITIHPTVQPCNSGRLSSENLNPHLRYNHDVDL